MRPRLAPIRLKDQSGLSLLEVILCIAIVSIAIISLVIITITAITTVRQSRDQARADQYSRQAVESLRVIRDQEGWQDFLKPGSQALAPNYYGLYTLTEAEGTTPPSITQQGVAITTKPPFKCSEIKSSDYLIPGSDGFYRRIMMYYPDNTSANDGTRVEITVQICYGYRQDFSSSTTIQTYLTNWQ